MTEPSRRPLAIVPKRPGAATTGAHAHVDLPAERAVLAAVLLDNRVLPRVARILEGPDDFSDPRHGDIWCAFLALWDARQPIDIETSCARLRAMERLNTVGGAQYLGELTDEIPTVAHVESHAGIVANEARIRRYIDALADSRAIAETDGDPVRALERAMGRMATARVTRRGAGWKSMAAIVDAAWERLIEVQEGRRHPVPTGLVTLDGAPPDPAAPESARYEGHLGGGLLGGELVVIAADQGGGKTAFALQLLRHAARCGFTCLLVSQEMDGPELHWRMACAIAGVPSTRVRAGRLSQEELEALQAASRELQGLPIRVCDTGTAGVADVRVGALEAQAEGPVHLIVVDYLQILDPPPGMDESKAAEVIDANARAMKKLAREVGCPVVLLSQFNRAGQLLGRKPRIQDLKGSGGIESHADLVWVLHPTEGRTDGPPPPLVDTDLLVLKARGGPTCTVKLRFERRFTRFVELPPDQQEALPDSYYDQNDPPDGAGDFA